MLTWKAKIENWNHQCIEDYDVLKYHISEIKKLKKQCETKEEFSERLRLDMQWRYWSRCEYELLIKKTEENRIVLYPLIGSDKFNLDVTDEDEFNWDEFFEFHANKQITRDWVKIDIYDQLLWNWDEFIDYCWYTRLPYERKNSKFER